MKRVILYISFAVMATVFLLPAVRGQEGTAPQPSAKLKPVVAKLRMMDQAKRKGFLLQAMEDSVQLLPTYMKISANTLKDPGTLSKHWTVPATSIQTLTLHRKDGTVRGTLIGLVAGAAAGWLIGYAQGDDPVYAYPDDADLGTILAVGVHNMWASSAEEKAAGGAIGGALLGAGTGAIIGALSGKVIEIGGSRKAYKAALETMRKRALIH